MNHQITPTCCEYGCAESAVRERRCETHVRKQRDKRALLNRVEAELATRLTVNVGSQAIDLRTARTHAGAVIDYELLVIAERRENEIDTSPVAQKTIKRYAATVEEIIRAGRHRSRPGVGRERSNS